jgi:cytoskeletal protein CcmA (bactofilin family)
MKTMSKISIALMVLIVALLAFPGTVLAQSPGGGNDQVVFGGTYTLEKGKELDGNLVILGGIATLEESSTVNGNITLTGGSLFIQGEVKGNITGVGGSITLGDTAVVDGDINTIGAALNRSNQAVIKGSVSSSGPGNFRFPLKWSTDSLKNLNLNLFQPVGNVLWGMFQALAMAALALLVTLFLPLPTGRVAHTISSQPVIAGALGLLTIVVAPALFIVLLVTIILIPLSLIGLLVLAIAFAFGWIAVGYETGRRLAAMFKVQWAVPVNAGVGTLVISLLSSVFSIIPCVGWVLPAVLAIVGLGGVLITRFGMQGSLPPELALGVAPSQPGSTPMEPPMVPGDSGEVPPAA